MKIEIAEIRAKNVKMEEEQLEVDQRISDEITRAEVGNSELHYTKLLLGLLETISCFLVIIYDVGKEPVTTLKMISSEYLINQRFVGNAAGKKNMSLLC